MDRPTRTTTARTTATKGLRVERIRVETRWTKELGEAVTVIYGDYIMRISARADTAPLLGIRHQGMV